MCKICNGYPGCPVCSEDVKKEQCPDCLGNGFFYVTESRGITEKSIWDIIPENERDTEPCETCGGSGEIEI